MGNKKQLQEILKRLDVDIKDLHSKVFLDEKVSARDKAFFLENILEYYNKKFSF